VAKVRTIDYFTKIRVKRKLTVSSAVVCLWSESQARVIIFQCIVVIIII